MEHKLVQTKGQISADLEKIRTVLGIKTTCSHSNIEQCIAEYKREILFKINDKFRGFLYWIQINKTNKLIYGTLIMNNVIYLQIDTVTILK